MDRIATPMPMDSGTQRILRVPQMLTAFSSLPIEIRLRIWAFAAPLRPRVIQIFYNREEETWHAWKDGCGGLPLVALVCRESFAEALNPYIRIFDTYFHLQIDTLFISDPLFTLRKPRMAFVCTEYVEQIRKIALTDEQLEGLAEMHNEFPVLYPTTTAVLREFKCLTRFTLVLSEDAAMDEDDLGLWLPDAGQGLDLETDDEGDEGDDAEKDDNFGSASSVELEGREEDLLADDKVLQTLDRQEREAMDAMPKGYFRQVGNIHFQNATFNADHWDSWRFYKEELPVVFNQEKKAFPEWRLPNICIVVVRYGLNSSHEDAEIHIRGDYDDGFITGESPKYLQWLGEEPS
jgi:hypothetical protein